MQFLQLVARLHNKDQDDTAFLAAVRSEGKHFLRGVSHVPDLLDKLLQEVGPNCARLADVDTLRAFCTSYDERTVFKNGIKGGKRVSFLGAVSDADAAGTATATDGHDSTRIQQLQQQFEQLQQRLRQMETPRPASHAPRYLNNYGMPPVSSATRPPSRSATGMALPHAQGQQVNAVAEGDEQQQQLMESFHPNGLPRSAPYPSGY